MDDYLILSNLLRNYTNLAIHHLEFGRSSQAFDRQFSSRSEALALLLHETESKKKLVRIQQNLHHSLPSLDPFQSQATLNIFEIGINTPRPSLMSSPFPRPLEPL